MSKKLGSLETLDREITRLRSRSKKLEGELDDQFTYLQNNYSSLLMKSVLPGIQLRTGIPSNFLELFLQNDRLRGALGRLLDRVFDKLSEVIEFVAEKLERKKPE